MAYQVNWLIENEVIYAHFWGVGDEAELREALSEITTMREHSARDAVHVITNTKGVTVAVPFQDSMKVIKEFKNASDNGWEIVIGKLDRIMSLSLSISRSLLRTKSVNLQSMDEAMVFLKKEDDTLHWDNLDVKLLELEGMSH